MNFDSLKDAWVNDKREDSHLSFKSVPLNRAFTLVTKVRKNMKKEFISQVMAFILLIFILYGSVKGSLSIFVVSIAIFLLLAQTIYYFFRFYVFYRNTGRYDLSMRKSISGIVYELELNIEIYRTFNYCALPLVILIIICGSTDLTAAIREVSGGSILRYRSLFYVFIKLILAQIALFFVLKWYIRRQYGRYLTELKKIMEDLETEE